jgi:hypothetical protein
MTRSQDVGHVSRRFVQDAQDISTSLDMTQGRVFLKLAPLGSQFVWFGHLVGPIMGVFCEIRSWVGGR